MLIMYSRMSGLGKHWHGVIFQFRVAIFEDFLIYVGSNNMI